MTITSDDAYRAGFLFAHERPEEPEVGAKQRGLYPADQDARIEWERGFMHQRCARALGHDTGEMVRCGIEAPSLLDPAVVILRLLAERDEAREQLAALRAAQRAVDTARAAWLDGWGVKGISPVDDLAAERAFFAAVERLAALTENKT